MALLMNLISTTVRSLSARLQTQGSRLQGSQHWMTDAVRACEAGVGCKQDVGTDDRKPFLITFKTAVRVLRNLCGLHQLHFEKWSCY
jgi:hypothetical protein